MGGPRKARKNRSLRDSDMAPVFPWCEAELRFERADEVACGRIVEEDCDIENRQRRICKQLGCAAHLNMAENVSKTRTIDLETTLQRASADVQCVRYRFQVRRRPSKVKSWFATGFERFQ